MWRPNSTRACLMQGVSKYLWKLTLFVLFPGETTGLCLVFFDWSVFFPKFLWMTSNWSTEQSRVLSDVVLMCTHFLHSGYLQTLAICLNMIPTGMFQLSARGRTVNISGLALRLLPSVTLLGVSLARSNLFLSCSDLIAWVLLVNLYLYGYWVFIDAHHLVQGEFS